MQKGMSKNEQTCGEDTTEINLKIVWQLFK